MNTNENTRNDTLEEVIELGPASVETKGTGRTFNEFLGHPSELGISE